MFYTPLIQKAVSLAGNAHRTHTRKNVNREPYIVHPMTVALLLARATNNEDLICAGILHDVVEDCGIKIEIIEKDFNENIAYLVNAVTEKDKRLPWETRKKLAIEEIGNMSKDAALLKTADCLANITSDIHGIKHDGYEAHMKLRTKTPEILVAKENKQYSALANAWPENPLLPEYKASIDVFASLAIK